MEFGFYRWNVGLSRRIAAPLNEDRQEGNELCVSAAATTDAPRGRISATAETLV